MIEMNLVTDSNSYETPKYIFDQFNEKYNFNYDLACTERNKKAKFLAPDTLSHDWHKLDGWQWLNPPYKPLKPWIEKAAKERDLGAKIVMLVPLTTIANDYYAKAMANAVVIVTKRLFFEYEGVVQGANRHNSCFLIYDKEQAQGIEYLAAR